MYIKNMIREMTRNLKNQHSRFPKGKEFDKIKEFLEKINISYIN
jgi:hypothetical protein